MQLGLYFDLRNPGQWRRPWPDYYAQTLAWMAGAETLMEAPLRGEDVTGEAQRVIDEIGQQIRDLAFEARKADSRQHRARLYGEFLARCAACHAGYRPD